MNSAEAQQLAAGLHEARLAVRERERLTKAVADLSVSDAYAIQEAGILLRLAAGERRVGLKMGLTSEAKRRQMGLESPVFGVLTDRMRIAAGGTLEVATGIHPKIEPEIAFLVGQELAGAITLEEAARACTGVAPAMEILDSRYVGFKYFSLPDVIADNASSFMFVLGELRPLQGLALDRFDLQLSVNGELKQRATSDAISGHPLRSLVQLCGLLARRGQVLPAGSVVLAGAATVAEPLKAGDRVALRVEGLGSVEIAAA